MKTLYASVAATNVPDNLNDGGRHGNLNSNTATAPLSRALQQQHQPDCIHQCKNAAMQDAFSTVGVGGIPGLDM
ncbi:hypothetical protein HDU77_011169, partial [Chytriomyces hyalinus]